MNYQEVMQQLEEAGTEQNRKIFKNHGAKEPLFGVAIKYMNPIAKKIKKNQALAEELYASGNYDAMYFAGMIADSKNMSEADYERWISQAYCYMIADYTVAVMLVDSPLALNIADKWIASGEELKMSAGWSAYCWLLGFKKDEEFDANKISQMLDTVKDTIHDSPNRVRYSMNGFVTAVGISFLPLHEKAVQVAEAIGKVKVYMGKNNCKVPIASEAIEKARNNGRLGFKRKATRC